MIDLWIAPELEFWPNFGTRTWYERSFGPFSGVNLWDEETEKEEQHLSCRQGSQTRFPTGTIKEITQHLSVTRHETPVFPAISVIYSEQFQSSSLWVDFPVGWFFWGALMILDAYLSIIHVCILSLVGGLEHFCFHIYIYIGNCIIPTDELSIIFQRGGSTTNQYSMERCLRTWRCGDGGGWADLEGYHEIPTVLSETHIFFEVIC